MARAGEILVGLDVGTTKVAAVVGEVRDDGLIDVIGVGICPSNSVRKGMIVHADQTMEAIRRAIGLAEQLAGATLSMVSCNVSGGHIKSFNNRGAVPIPTGWVTHEDVDRVIDIARAVKIPPDRQIIHVVPQGYKVDDNDGYEDPIQIMGSRLEVSVHLVTALNTAVENIKKCVARASLDVSNLYAGFLASSTAVLQREEKELGVVLVDIGGGTTDIAVWHNCALVHSAVLPYGGEHLTHDIATGLRTPRKEAERLKILHGCALSSMIGEDELIQVASVGGREPTERYRALLCDIIEPRLEEIFRLVELEIQNSNFADLLGAGVVLTGGTASIQHIDKLAQDVLNMPVRVGKPGDTSLGFGGDDGPAGGEEQGPMGQLVGHVDLVRAPTFATAIGVLLHAAAEKPASPKKKRFPGVIWDWLLEVTGKMGRAITD